MKYDREEFLKEVLVRSDRMAKEAQKRQIRQLSALSGVLGVVLLVVMAAIVRIEAPGQTMSVYGSFLLSPQAGGFFLVAILAFALGCTVTLLIQKYRKSKEGKTDS